MIFQVFPGNLLSHTFLDPDSPHHTLVARSEVERRGEYMELLEKEVGNHHPSIVQLVRQCLHNVPEQRPSTDEVLGSLQRLKVEVDGLYGGSLVKLDIDKVLLTKEMKMKDKKIEELTQYEVYELLSISYDFSLFPTQCRKGIKQLRRELRK